MKNAIKVLALDLLALRPYVKSLYLFLAFVLIGIMTGNASAAMSMLFVPMLIYSSYIFAIAERQGIDKLVLSFAVRRTDVVRGRYLCTLLFVLTGLALTLLLTLGMSQTSGRADELFFQEQMMGFWALSLIYLFVFSVQAPIWFRFGYLKAKAVTIIPFALIGAGVPTLNILLRQRNGGREPDMDGIMRLLENNLGAVLSVSSVICGVLLLVSYYVSVGIYNKKDL